MKKSLPLILVFLTLITLPSLGSQSFAQEPSTDTQFFMSLEDIPLMPGLEEIPAETLAFDKPEGRIVESYAMMNSITQEQALGYYAQVLPQFGWGKNGSNKYFRGTEHLEISFETQGAQAYLKIMIRPSL